ncbi:MAG: MCE family protein [Phycisphaerae bacterium]|nr:MCE family protein [Phycisphaerae bacterium]
MSIKANYFKIGAFVIATVTILLGGIIVLSAGLLTRDTLLLETYMDESVQGLSVGSPVLYRGVQIGTVKQITFLPRGYPEQMKYGSEAYHKYSRYVLVIMAVDRSNFPQDADDDTIRAIIRGWVLSGLRLKIVFQGITGISYMEADYIEPQRQADKPVELEWEPVNMYIPAAPSLFKNLTDSIESILKTLDTIDYDGIAASLITTLDTIKTAVAEAEVPKMRTEVVGLMTDLRETNRLIMDMLDKSKNPDGVNIPETVAQLDKTLQRLDKFVSVQQSEIDDILNNVRRTTENIREFTDSLKKYPGLIFGGPPSPSEVSK